MTLLPHCCYARLASPTAMHHLLFASKCIFLSLHPSLFVRKSLCLEYFKIFAKLDLFSYLISAPGRPVSSKGPHLFLWMLVGIVPGVVHLNIVIITFRPAIVISTTLGEKGGFSIEKGESWEPILQTTATFIRKLVDLALCVPRGICEGDTRKIQANALTLRLINLIHCKFRSVLNEKI